MIKSRRVLAILAVGATAGAVTSIGLLSSSGSPTRTRTVGSRVTATQKPRANEIVVRYILTDAPPPPAGLTAPSMHGSVPPPALGAMTRNGAVGTALFHQVERFVPRGLHIQWVRDLRQPCGTAGEVQFGNTEQDLIEVTFQCLTRPMPATALALGDAGVTVRDAGPDQILMSAIATPVPGVGSFYTVARSNSSGQLVSVTVSGGAEAGTPGRAAPISQAVALELAQTVVP